MTFHRAEALLEKQKIIDRLNELSEERSNLKGILQQVSQIAESTPKDIAGEEIPEKELDKNWTRIKTKVEKLNVK